MTSLAWSLSATEWHGFAGQGLVYTSDNGFFDQDSGWSGEYTELGLSLAQDLGNRTRLAGQVLYRQAGDNYDQGFKLDYLFLDWRPQLGEGELALQLGRIKNQAWLYSAFQDTPVARPGIFMPQSVYPDGLRSMSLGLDGISLGYGANTELGRMALSFAYGKPPISDNAERTIFGDLNSRELKANSSRYWLLDWQTPGQQFEFKLSWLAGDFDHKASPPGPLSDGNVKMEFLTGSMIYSREQWELTLELMKRHFRAWRVFPAVVPSEVDAELGYIQLRRIISPRLSVFGRFDYINMDTSVSAANYDQTKDYTLGLNWQFNANWQLRAEYHWVDGVTWIPPLVRLDARGLEENWQMGAVQLIYAF
ncbi:hypothetical protein [Gallaecimonas sp. GXIMD4217]|uniref:hypothetical protein n=1 Tax=Gallaecimonas sp. GXIMD4217 TaxID=3131927 RepID=UPI00311AE701